MLFFFQSTVFGSMQHPILVLYFMYIYKVFIYKYLYISILYTYNVFIYKVFISTFLDLHVPGMPYLCPNSWRKRDIHKRCGNAWVDQSNMDFVNQAKIRGPYLSEQHHALYDQFLYVYRAWSEYYSPTVHIVATMHVQAHALVPIL